VTASLQRTLLLFRNAFLSPRQACGRDLPYTMAPRRPGDVSVVYAEPKLAKQELGWEAVLGLDAMCADTWRWISANPDGFNAPA